MTALRVDTASLLNHCYSPPIFDGLYPGISIKVVNSGGPVRLTPEEADLSSKFSSKKRREQFASGRQAAREALAGLDIMYSNFSLLHRNDGCPLWPPEVVGSISHCKDTAIAVAGKKKFFTTLGVDMESASRRVKPGLGALICASEKEEKWASTPARLMTIFSAKESIYKALYPVLRRYISFQEVELIWNPDKHGFELNLLFSTKKDFRGLFTAVAYRENMIFSLSVLQKNH